MFTKDGEVCQLPKDRIELDPSAILTELAWKVAGNDMVVELGSEKHHALQTINNAIGYLTGF